MLEHGEVQSIFKLRATSCLFSAIENSHDAVEITSLEPDKAEFQVEVLRTVFFSLYLFTISYIEGHSLR